MTMYQKPSAFTQVMNSIMRFFASLGLMPRKMVTLEVKGRRSGQTRSTVVNVVEHDGQRYLVAPRGNTEWVRNVRAAGGRAVLHRGKREEVKLEEVPPDQRAPTLKTYLRQNAMATKSHFGVEPDAPIEEFQRIAPDHPVFQITKIS